MENVPFYFAKDLEASDPIEDNIVNGKTVKLQKQKPNSFVYILMQTNRWKVSKRSCQAHSELNCRIMGKHAM